MTAGEKEREIEIDTQKNIWNISENFCWQIPSKFHEINEEATIKLIAFGASHICHYQRACVRLYTVYNYLARNQTVCSIK
jgi:hypothetical protein